MTDPDHNGEVKCPHGMVTTLNHHTGRSCIRPIGMNEINHKRSIVNATARRSRPTKGLFQAANLKSISRKLSVKYMSNISEEIDQIHLVVVFFGFIFTASLLAVWIAKSFLGKYSKFVVGA